MSESLPDSAADSDSRASKQLTIRILIGMGAGVLLGVGLNLLRTYALSAETAAIVQTWVSDGVLHAVGRIFVNLLQVIVIPLVLTSLISGTAAMEDIVKVGRVGLKTLGFYLATTTIALVLAMTAALIVRPGASFELESEVEFSANEAPALVDVLIGVFPRNIFESMTGGEMLPIIVFAVLFGLSITMAGAPGRRVLAFIEDANEVVMKLVWIVMQLAPYGVFALIARTFANEGFTAFVPLLKYFGVVLAVLLLHLAVTYPVLLKLLSGLDPLQFLRKLREVQLFAFSTASSNATIPVSLRTVEHRLGVKNSIASFSIPLGATINMDGTAIMQGVATVFIAQVYGFDLGLGALLTVVVTAVLASIGTAGVPGVGLIMLAMVLQQVNLPVEGIGLIIGIDRLLDMVRTAVNVTGDCAVTCIVAKSEGEWDEPVFRAP
ncbi:MAG: dicarboxylate/amino acid:cation symporter [Opitutales bacterium]